MLSGMEVSEARRLKHKEEENRKLKYLVPEPRCLVPSFDELD